MSARYRIKAIVSLSVTISLLVLFIKPVYAAVVLDSYTASTAYGYLIRNVHWGSDSAQAQSWNQHLYTKAKVTSIRLKAYKVGNPSGTLYCKIASHAGTYGTSSKPDEDLETSTNSYSIASLSSLSNRPTTMTFTFAGDTEILKDDPYTFYVYCSGGILDGSKYVVIQGYKGHDGNKAHPTSVEGVWSSSSNDLYFQVYGEEIPSGEWHDIVSWNHNLTTRQWLDIVSWTFNLMTREWLPIISWTSNLLTRQWLPIISWTSNLLTRQWITISSWNLVIIAREWLDILDWSWSFLHLQQLGRVETPELLMEFTMLPFVVNNHVTSLSGMPVETEFRVKNKLGVPLNCSSYVFITTGRRTIYPELSANQTLFSVAQNETVFRRLRFNLPFKNENYILHVKIYYVYHAEPKEAYIIAAFRTSVGTALIEILLIVLGAIVCLGALSKKQVSSSS